MTDWDAYNNKTKDLLPHTLVVEALSYIQGTNRALDLGCGAMRDIPAIAGAGFKRIDAVDSNSSIQVIAQEYAKQGIPLTFYPVFYTEFDFGKDTYDFISAQYALPFSPPEAFDEMFGRLVESLKIGGVFTGQFFGKEDSWADNPKM